VLVGVRPEALVPGGPPDGSSALRLPGVVDILEDLGAERIAYLRAGVQPVELADRPMELQGTLAVRSAARAGLRPGAREEVHADVGELHLFDRAGGDALAHPADGTP
jgi:hypothetical protein